MKLTTDFEWTIFDTASLPGAQGDRFMVAETNNAAETRRFKTLPAAKEWLAKQGCTFNPRTGAWR